MKEMEMGRELKDASVNEQNSTHLVSVGPDRIKAISDAVFAIALTLLILQVKVPSPSQIANETDLRNFLLQQWPAYLSYALSVVIIGHFWVAYHGLFHYIRRANRMLLWLNILFLLCVTFIPFPAALMSQFSNYRTSVVIYGATLAVAGLVFDLMRWTEPGPFPAIRSTRTTLPGISSQGELGSTSSAMAASIPGGRNCASHPLSICKCCPNSCVATRWVMSLPCWAAWTSWRGRWTTHTAWCKWKPERKHSRCPQWAW
jgi:uncharacterized membrane protein